MTVLLVETVVSEASLHVKQPQTWLTYRRCGKAPVHGDCHLAVGGDTMSDFGSENGSGDTRSGGVRRGDRVLT